LKEVVGGKRLSQSKVKELTDMSMSLMQVCTLCLFPQRDPIFEARFLGD
jgi:hypothetical protein